MSRIESNRARFGPYEVDLHTHELWKYGTRLKLVGQPFEILSLLLRRAGDLVTRDEMRERLWPSDTFVDFNHGLNAAVNKLREALSDSADDPRYVETLPRRGYRFVAAIEWIPAQAAESNSSGVAYRDPPELVVSAIPTDGAAAEGRHGARFPPYAVIASAVIALLAIASVAFWFLHGDRLLANRAPVERIRPLFSVTETSGPAFSPDGNYVAFSHDGLHGAGIYVTRVFGDQVRQLTNDEHDCCPVWSPDGRWIAFSRYNDGDKQHSIYLLAADGSDQKHAAEQAAGAHSAAFTPAVVTTERRLDTGGVVPRRGEIDWSPDGKWIAFSGPTGIYLTSPDHPDVHRLIETPTGAEDWGPQFSPDGFNIMFVRNWQVGEPDEVWLVPTNGGDHTRLFSERGRITSPPQWSADGRSVIYSSNRTGHPSLLRVSLDAPDAEIVLKEAGSPAWDPAVSRHGYRLAYERLQRSLSIWQLDLSSAASAHPALLVASTSDTDQGPGAQFCPDGKKLAYMSDRTGTMEIWVADRDGSNPYQLTAVGGAGTPRWSSDCQSIAFDVGSTTGERVVTISLNGGPPHVLAEGIVPSWSRDGKWVYFASGRSGSFQVWKVPAAGGTPIQVTQHGGHAAFESLDGRYLYYAKNSQAEPEVWRVPVAGGEEVPMPLVRPGTWASWQVVEGGILFVGPSLGHQAVLSFFDAARNRTSTVAVLERTPFWLGATTDGKTVAFDQPGREQSRAMLIENFR